MSGSWNKEGWIYLVQPADGGLVKIGFAYNPAERLKALQIGSPVPLRIIATFPGTRALEQSIHRYLWTERSHGEWFRPGCRFLDAVTKYLGALPVGLVRDPDAEAELRPTKRQPPALNFRVPKTISLL